MVDLLVRPEVSRAVNRSVLVTGAARSGTTLMGNLLHTLTGIEYLFEPPLLFALLPLLERPTPPRWWRTLFETYLFEDFLMDAVAGRRLNFNHRDDSNIERAKSPEEIALRLDSQYRRADLFSQAVGHRIAFKMPEVLGYLPRLHRAYPQMRMVVMWREPEAVVDSLIQKNWYGTDVETSRTTQGPWRSLGPDVPFWLPEAQRERYLGASELERLYLYYVLMYGKLWQMPWALVVDYDLLVSEPDRQFERVCQYIGEPRWTVRTTEVMATISRQGPVPPATLWRLPGALRRQVVRVIDLATQRSEALAVPGWSRDV